MFSPAILVGAWIQAVLCAAVLLLLCNLVLRWLVQPVERIRLIQFTLAAVLTVPMLLALAPWPAWRLGLISSTSDELARSVPGNMHEERAASELSAASRLPDGSDSVDIRSEVAAAPVDVSPLRTAEVAGESTSNAPPIRRLASVGIWTAAMIVIVVVHAVAFLYFVFEWCLGTAHLRRLLRSAETASNQVHFVWNTVTQGRGGHVELLVSPAVDTPLTFGWLHPVVVIPEEIAITGGPSLRFCLAHEWSHVEQADLLSWRCVWGCQFLLWHGTSHFSGACGGSCGFARTYLPTTGPRTWAAIPWSTRSFSWVSPRSVVLRPSLGHL